MRFYKHIIPPELPSLPVEFMLKLCHVYEPAGKAGLRLQLSFHRQVFVYFIRLRTFSSSSFPLKSFAIIIPSGSTRKDVGYPWIPKDSFIWTESFETICGHVMESLPITSRRASIGLSPTIPIISNFNSHFTSC